jgi:hypothetical protein
VSTRHVLGSPPPPLLFSSPLILLLSSSRPSGLLQSHIFLPSIHLTFDWFCPLG